MSGEIPLPPGVIKIGQDDIFTEKTYQLFAGRNLAGLSPDERQRVARELGATIIINVGGELIPAREVTPDQTTPTSRANRIIIDGKFINRD